MSDKTVTGRQKTAAIVAEIDPEALATMRERGGDWYAYRNADLGHPEIGRLKFLKCGPGCTLVEPPQKLPDMGGEINWRYQLDSPNPVVSAQ